MVEVLTIAIGLLIFGTVAGFISSTPLGPINLLVAEHYIHRPRFNMNYFLGGVILADVASAYIAFWGYYAVVKKYDIEQYIVPIGAGFIVVLGVMSLRAVLKGEKIAEEATELKFKKHSKWWAAIQGILMCGGNPGFLFYWIYMAGAQEDLFSSLLGIVELPSKRYLLMIILGVILGDFIWFGLFIRLLKYGAEKMGLIVVKRVRLIISIVLIAMGLFFLYKQYLM